MELTEDGKSFLEDFRKMYGKNSKKLFYEWLRCQKKSERKIYQIVN